MVLVTMLMPIFEFFYFSLFMVVVGLVDGIIIAYILKEKASKTIPIMMIVNIVVLFLMRMISGENLFENSWNFMMYAMYKPFVALPFFMNSIKRSNLQRQFAYGISLILSYCATFCIMILFRLKG